MPGLLAPAAASAGGCGRRSGGSGGRSRLHLVDRADDLVERDHLDPQGALAAAAERVDDLAERERLGDDVRVAAHPAARAWTGSGGVVRAGSRTRRPPEGNRCLSPWLHSPCSQAGFAATRTSFGVMSNTFQGITLRIVVGPDLTVGHRHGRRGGCGRAGATWARAVRARRAGPRCHRGARPRRRRARAGARGSAGRRRGRLERALRSSSSARPAYWRWVYWCGPWR